MYKNISSAVMGSINMDFIMSMERIPESGENLLGKTYSYAFGGKGANQATALKKLGAKVKMIGKVADDSNGNSLINNLNNLGVDTSAVAKNGDVTGLAVIMLDGEGKNRIVVYKGANAQIDPKTAADAIDDSLDLLLVQFETNEEAVIETVNKAVKENIITVIDCGPAKAFSLERMQGVTIITPNESETKALTGISPDNEEHILSASKILEERSKAKYVVLKLGSRGCSVWDGKNLKIMPTYPSKVVDTTAAGDCFTAAMALEYAVSGDIYKACDIGNKAGSIAVSRLGADASMPTYDELINL
ncbi:MAG: ribokinase [Ruminiclostridium sp.]|nr:ribokinase [Ruminiclostridium sp.]